MTDLVMFVVVVFLFAYSVFMWRTGTLKDKYIEELQGDLFFERQLRYRAATKKSAV